MGCFGEAYNVHDVSDFPEIKTLIFLTMTLSGGVHGSGKRLLL